MMTRKKKRNKRKKTGISLLLAAAFLTVLGDPRLAIAQAANAKKGGSGATRTIEGQVLTKTGAAVPGAVVLLKDNKTLQVRSYIAQSNGDYHFFGLSTEVNYTLRAETQEMTSKQKQVSVFDSHADVKLDLKLSQEIKRSKKQPSQEE